MKRKGFSLLELTVTIAAFTVFTAVSAYLFRAMLLSWSSEEKNADLRIALGRAVFAITYDIRSSREVSSPAGSDELRFRQGTSDYWVYYFYNGSSGTALYKAGLSGGINGTYTPGEGTPVLTDVLPPPASDLSVEDDLVRLYLRAARSAEEAGVRARILPRNL
ncbi:MAG: prepilin-type N-terminal cleavage/methylation domain-containing protein [Candidatus Omnitrophica bacterium]|nr:prepilin-type N-terminal cleavage/methylation domain-containing protein [Candidatus Omnitrophota bacterium]